MVIVVVVLAAASLVGQPVSNLRLGYERSTVLQYPRSDLVDIAHVHRARAYAMCEDAERRDLYGPIADVVAPVVRELSQGFNFVAACCLDAQVSALQLISGDNLHVCYFFIAALLDGTLNM